MVKRPYRGLRRVGNLMYGMRPSLADADWRFERVCDPFESAVLLTPQGSQMDSQGQPESPHPEGSKRPSKSASFGFVRFADPLFSIT